MYYAVLFYNDSKDKKFYAVNQIVTEAFLDNPNNLERVIHKNNDLKDNNVNNLKWATEKEWQKFRLKLKGREHSKDDFIVMEKPYDNYSINNKGEIYSLHKNKILIPEQRDKYNYMICLASGEDGNIYKDFVVYRLVSQYFMKKEDNKEWIWHKDGDYSNNDVENLECVDWNTLKKNRVNHAKKKLLKGELKDFVEIEDHDGMYYIDKKVVFIVFINMIL